MKITREIQAQARRLLRLCIDERGLLREERVRQVATVLQEKRLRHYAELLTAFAAFVRRAEAQHTVVTESAVPLTDEEQAQVRAKLDARMLGLRYEWHVKPELIGGLRIRIGDQVTDASVRTRIRRLTDLINGQFSIINP